MSIINVERFLTPEGQALWGEYVAAIGAEMDAQSESRDMPVEDARRHIAAAKDRLKTAHRALVDAGVLVPEPVDKSGGP